MTSPTTPAKPFELALEPLEPPSRKAATPEVTTIEISVAPTRPAGPAPVVRAAARPAPAAPDATGEPGAPAPDRFVTRASRELQDGNVDQRLWARVLLVSGEDQSQARTAYVRARATALRLAARDQGTPPEPSRPTAPGAVPSETLAGKDEPRPDRPVGRMSRPPVLRMGIAAAALGVVGALGWMTFHNDDAPAVVAKRVAAPAPTVVVAAKTHEDVDAAERAAAAAIAAELESRVKALRDAKNWNVMVLNAAEWTRKQPDNAIAWNLLATGYANLGQLNDAREAADTATRHAPGDARLWRELGAIDVALDESERALKSYTKATSLDRQDFGSHVQAGILATQLQRYPEARADFDKALELRADDEGALCGLAVLARQQGHIAEADTVQKRVKALGKACASGVSVGVRMATADRPGTSKSATASLR